MNNSRRVYKFICLKWGLQALEDVASRLKASGRELILCGAREQPSELMNQAGFVRHIGKGNFCADVEHALERAKELHEAQVS